MDQNMTTFSSIGNTLPKITFEETDETCEKHKVKLINFADRAICPVCAKELTEQHSQDLVAAETEKHYSKNKKWLSSRSLFTDGTLKAASFDTYETSDEETAVNKEKARQIAGQYLKGATFNTIMTGKVGTGKSHLSMSMLRAVNDHSNPFKRCLFVSIDELISLLRESYKSPETHTEHELRNLCVEADLLVLDDLGAEVGAISTERGAANDVVRMINAIVNGRMDKPTIFTTNLNSGQLRKMYDERIASRILKGVTNERIIKFEKTKDKRNRIEF